MLIPDLKEAKKRSNKEVLIKTNEYIIDNHLKDLGKGKKYFVKTYGCQMNEHDGENIKAILEDMSYIETDKMEDADVILLNTCAIRENAHNKVFGYLGRIKHLKEERPHVIAGICGCMAQEEVVVKEIMKKYKWLDIVFGTHNIHKLPQILNSTIEKKEQEIQVMSVEGDIIENIPVKRDSKYKAWINIMYGCDKFCTYCIVPYTRGKQRSRHPEYILNEIKELVKNGYKEVTLLGQNVNAYGKDFKDMKYDMSNLLQDVANTKIERIKFVTSHPWDFNDDMIKVIKENENVLPYIHLPVQSGSNRILKLMGRKYTKESYLELVKKLKENIKDLSLTTDIIVGFPNETMEDFKETLDIVNECKYDLAYTFIYSPRVGTPAANIKDNVTKEEKEERLQILNDLINKYSKESNDRMLNKTLSVLIDGKSEKEGMLSGYSKENKLVNVKADLSYIGKIVNVKITDAKTWSLDGVLDE